MLLTTLAAVLSFLTGIVSIGATAFDGPLAAYVPSTIARAAGFTGTMTGILLLVSAYGLYRGYRAAWLSTVVLLPVTAAQGLIQTSVLALPLVILSLVSIPIVVANRGYFDRHVDLGLAQAASLAAIVGVQVYGTIGTYALREQFDGVNTVLDAFYFTLVTASTVGYGDTVATTQEGRLFTMSVLLTGVASFAVALGTLLGPLIEARLATALGNMSDRQLDLLEHHYVIAGHGDLTEPILESLGDTDSVVITSDPDTAKRISERGFEVVTGNPSDEAPQQRVHIERAAGFIAATNDDAQDALAILTARELNPDIRIVAAATDRENVPKLRRAGADVVLSPVVLGGRLLVDSVLGNDDPERVVEQLLDMQHEE